MITTEPTSPIDRMEHTPRVGIRLHPLCELFPEMNATAFAELREDIRKNGVIEPIVFLNDEILDGRNRYFAARELCIEYPRVEFTGDDPRSFVLAKNLSRRHLTESQRAMVAARLAKMPHGGDRGANQHGMRQEANLPVATTNNEAATLLNVSERSVKTAKQVVEHGAPELVKAVETGAVTVSAAAEVSKLPAAEQVKVVADGSAKKVAKEQREAKKPDAVLKAEKPRAPSAAEHEALQAEVEELREANAALTADVERLTAEIATFEDMKLEFARGGFDEVIKTLKETIEVQKTRIERESQEKVRNLNTSEMWRKRAAEAGWSNDVEFDIPGRAA